MLHAREKLSPSLWEEITPLLQRHWNEIALRDVFGPVDIDKDAYGRAEASNMLRVYTARREDGSLAGYAVYFVMPNFHYHSKLVAEADVFFLVPEERRGLTGLRLLRFADRELRGEGVNVIVQKVKVAHDCGVLFKSMGYTHAENVWMKVV
jgi:hypothetical protein